MAGKVSKAPKHRQLSRFILTFLGFRHRFFRWWKEGWCCERRPVSVPCFTLCLKHSSKKSTCSKFWKVGFKISRDYYYYYFFKPSHQWLGWLSSFPLTPFQYFICLPSKDIGNSFFPTTLCCTAWNIIIDVFGLCERPTKLSFDTVTWNLKLN